MVGRRRFLILGVGTGAGAAIGLPGLSTSASAAALQSVWRLNAQWGFPVPPDGKTKCVCNACHLHSANKVFLTEAAAISGRIHLCCVCQPMSLQLLTDDVNGLFPGPTTVIDLRQGDNAAQFAAAIARAQSPAPSDTTATAAPVAPAATLPPAGGESRAPLVAALTFVGLGAVAARIAKRPAPIAGADEHPPRAD
jgi:hypothetical protein